jgi:ribosomal protein S18 acetylase RimI-like enzyme
MTGPLPTAPPGFRTTARSDDAAAVGRLVEATGFFNPEEIGIAVELVEERIAKGDASGYFFLFADGPSGLLGYACYGPIAGTAESYDLYWVAVHPQAQGHGLGRRLLLAAESAIASRGGGRVYAETSSRDLYAPTRAFYLRCGYTEVARLDDFYGEADAKVIYLRVVPGAG